MATIYQYDWDFPMNYDKYDTICCKHLIVELQWIVLNWTGKSIINNKYNEYEWVCIFGWLHFTV